MKNEKHDNNYVRILVNEKINKDATEITIETWEFSDNATLLNKKKEVLKGKFRQLIPKTVKKHDNGMIKEIATERYESNVNEEGVECGGKIYITKTTYEKDATVKEVISAIQQKFRNELQMECENCTQMCPLKPKYYIKLHRETVLEKILKNGPFKKDHDGNYEISTKGILTSKKGNAQFANMVYDTLVNQVIFIKNPIDMLSSLTKHMCDFLSDRFDAKDLCKVTELGSDYANEGYFMNVFANYLTSQGMQVKPGDRLEYLVVRTRKEIAEGVSENMGAKCREYTMWSNDPNREGIDYSYYIEKGLQEQYDCLFGVGNTNIITDPRLGDLGYKPQFSWKRDGTLEIGKSRKHFIHFSKPIKMISSLVKDYMGLSDAEFAWVYSNMGFYYDPKVPRNQYIAVILNTFMDRVCKFLNTIYPQECI